MVHRRFVCSPSKHDWQFDKNLTPKGKHHKIIKGKEFTWQEKCYTCEAVRTKQGSTLRIGKGPKK